MIVDSSLRPSGRVPVTAVTVTSAVMSVPELVMNALEPLITHSSSPVEHRAWSGCRRRPTRCPARSARSRPAPRRGSSFGSHVAFCSSVPKR